MRVIGDFSHTTYLLGVVDVYRLCRECRRPFKLRRKHMQDNYCGYCEQIYFRKRTRSITITALGRADLRAWKEAGI